MISSGQNPKLKLVRALNGRSKERREARAFLAEGVRLVEEALAADWPFRFVLFSDNLSERGVQLLKKLETRGVECEKVKSGLLQSLSETETSQGMIAILDDARLQLPKSPNLILIPDSVRDPGNLGTLLRTADATGVQAVFLPPETTDAFAPKVVRAGMGAHFRLPIHSMGWEEIRRVSQSARLVVYLADMEGRSCWESDLRGPLALIVGGEAEGAGREARKLASEQISIPMPGAAVAGSILMFEVIRQRSSTTKVSAEQ